jgi:GMP synthase-like glutamine amidotransferase
VADWAAARGVELEVLRPAAGDPGPAPGSHDAVVALGSDCSVARSRDPWIAVEVAALRAAHDAGVPVLGLCFGAQALAAALGGDVRRAGRPEIGWVALDRPIRLGGDEAGVDGPFFGWHEDVFTVPPGATELARSPEGPQAVVIGRSLALQFHPEVDAAIVDAWLDWGRSQLADADLDEDALRAETAERAADARRRAFALFDGWAASWLPAARSPGRPAA